MIVVGEQITENDLAIMQKTGLSIWEAYKVGYIVDCGLSAAAQKVSASCYMWGDNAASLKSSAPEPLQEIIVVGKKITEDDVLIFEQYFSFDAAYEVGYIGESVASRERRSSGSLSDRPCASAASAASCASAARSAASKRNATLQPKPRPRSPPRWRSPSR